MKFTTILKDTGLSGLGSSGLAIGMIFIAEEGKLEQGCLLAAIGLSCYLLKYLLRKKEETKIS